MEVDEPGTICKGNHGREMHDFQANIKKSMDVLKPSKFRGPS
jgi:hypothetical protein